MNRIPRAMKIWPKTSEVVEFILRKILRVHSQFLNSYREKYVIAKGSKMCLKLCLNRFV